MIAYVVLKSFKDSRSLNDAETQSRMTSNRSVRPQADKMILWHEFTMNTSPKFDKWISITILKFWSDWDSPFSAGGQKNPEVSRLDSASLQFTHVPRSSRLDVFGSLYIFVAQKPPSYPDMFFCYLWPFPKNKTTKKRHGQHQREYTKHLRSFPKDVIKIVFQHCQNR